MYKAKLQELCHRKRWGLPQYSALRDGPDHDPRFKASVSVNGRSFDCPKPCRSSKQAHDEAAEIAYLHFTSPFPAPVISTEPKVDGASGSSGHPKASGVDIGSTSAQPNERGPKIGETCHSHEVQSDSPSITDDEGFQMNNQYKNPLQNYAKWKQFDEPFYSSVSDGSPHACNCKATVIVAGHAFQNKEVCHTPEEADHAAAKNAVSSLLLDTFPKSLSISYKNLLLEFTQKEGFFEPEYETTQAGPPHSLSFLSTVEVEGEVYRGKAAKSKKQAEQNAAMVAYTILSECALDQTPELVPSNLVPHEAIKTPTTSSPAIKHEEHAKESEVDEVASLDAWIEKSPPTCSEHTPPSPKIGSSSSRARDLSEKKSYLLGNKIRVYPYYPDRTELPEGITVLPISDNKWVAVSLEFPNEACH